MKVSFDYDDTLSRVEVEEYAKRLVAEGHQVWIVTARPSEEHLKMTFKGGEKPDWNREVFEAAGRIGIPNERIKFMNYTDKIEFLRGNGFTFHLDDDGYELYQIMLSGDICETIDSRMLYWRNACDNAIKRRSLMGMVEK